MMRKESTTRRPLKSRQTRWAAVVARFLASAGVRPNQISVASAILAGAAGLCLWVNGKYSTRWSPWLLIAAAVLIQGRLLCNLFDGMVAIEGGFKTKSGEIFNELPDRFADAFILIGAGYAAPRLDWMPLWGWLAALLAVGTAYVRALGASAGASQHFCGPMAKPHRMAVLTVACLAGAVAAWCKWKMPFVSWSLVIVVAGCLVTVFRRTRRIIRELERR